MVVKVRECSPRLEFKRELGRQNEGMQPKIGISKGTWSSKRENAAQDPMTKGNLVVKASE
ncbi:hypothetical protein P4489_01455 [Heyndrickxia sporothermodurans]|uniref:hypothetical protein n=1 Tax=Heyndrickxia sporothermodurans TaxID=46224 RepID=UPI0013660604|nr:hypothetical protein [Heyndrickxia sporothermodurans]MED3653025.1 hypothetical protein [Heyndrickxia sporothermodurans]